LSEGRLCFCRCVEHYPDVSCIQHFFSLYRTAYWRRVTTLARRRSARAHCPVIPFSTLAEGGDGEFSAGLAVGAGGMDTAGLTVLRNEAPPHISRLLSVLVEGAERGDRRPLLRQFAGRHESLNAYLCRIAGMNPEKTNMLQEVMAWVRGRDVREFKFRRLSSFA
jgi:hypothetical protein